MGLRERITSILSGEDDGDGARYECNRCGATFDRLETPCENCGSSVMVPLD